MSQQYNNTKELEIEIKLHINKRLYEKGLITEEMYTRAKEIILKGLTTAS
jgi:uncharacterized protein YqgQ